MSTFKNPKFIERYEDVEFNLETPLITVIPNATHQKKDGYRFVINNSGEITPFDWYNARLDVDFKVDKIADGADIADNDHIGIVNGSSAFIKQFDIKVNGIKVFNCSEANQCVNIKNLLEYNPAYTKSIASNEFYYLDTKRTAAEGAGETQNKGFAIRKSLLGTSNTVNMEIKLNRYSFFEVLNDELLPNTKVELVFEIESDNNLIWRTNIDCRVIITKMVLLVPRITFNSEGQTQYISRYLKPHKWTYLHEKIERSNSTQQRAGIFNISSGLSKPRHVFIYILN